MPSSAETIAAAIGEGVILSGATRWKMGGGGIEGKHKVEVWLDRTYPHLSDTLRGNLLARIENTVRAGEASNRRPVDQQIDSRSIADQTVPQRLAGMTGRGWNHYAVEYKYVWKDENGREHTTYRQKLFRADGTWSRNQLLQMGLMEFDSLVAFEKEQYKDKQNRSQWSGQFYDLNIKMQIYGAWNEIPGES